MSLSVEELVADVKSLATFPAAGLQVAKVVSDESSTPLSIAQAAEADPALAMSLLRIANSAAISRGKSVDNVTAAVTRLGREQVKALALGVSVAGAFKNLPTKLVSMQDFWRHSVYCAVASRQIAERGKLADAGSAFTAGLLHDIGHLVMFSYRPEQMVPALEVSRDNYDGILNYEIERDELGFDHCDVGAELARQWQLPAVIAACIRDHHRPGAHGDCPDLVMAVHIANSIAILADRESEDLSEAPPIETRAWEQLGIAWYEIVDLLAETRDNASELLEVFGS